ncbi:phosphoesterase [Colletotrichum graminicola]|uniref:Phosphoesterase n=1 Tax=Colletotrichum graminicola (strain M1.001 / M2 / FGSC 10212) TaxID=645133 RepID=E3QWC3_COLGM|nr:phosphoesterase [Colletotrichum graminicola M1.001]EFQ35161.1 phosphoesterase [Colletotrichum graminicola M1.001]WDK10043.1 phosphoesterase [Colletotrichum graminicola]
MRLSFISLAGSLAIVGATHIGGRAFDRYISIWLENQDFVKAVQDSSIADLKKEGILLSNYYAHTHPSQANYIAALAGDYFGMNHNDRVRLPLNVSTIVDLLDWRGLPWKAYMEDIPGPGYMAAASDGQTGDGKWDYVRQHNPFVSFDSINLNGSRLLKIVGFDDWKADFEKKEVPQWVFMSPNMMNDGHNTSLEYATKWAHDFLMPMLPQGVFKERTLIHLTYDESEDHEKPNQIVSLLLGSAIPKQLKGTEDKTFYTHYSMLSTVEYNWEMPNLGRYDVGANIFKFVQDLGSQIIVPNKDPPNMASVNNSESYFGALNNDTSRFRPYPPPNLALNGSSGLPILDHVRLQWVYHEEPTPYDGSGTLYDANFQPQYIPKPV